MNVNEIYNLLGNMLFSSVETEFKEAYLEVQRTMGSVEVSGSYLDKSDLKLPIRRLRMNERIPAAIHELHKITTEGDNNKWNRLLMTIDPNGKFGMNFINDEELEKELEFYKAGGKPQDWIEKKSK